jgi:hypothetical protein
VYRLLLQLRELDSFDALLDHWETKQESLWNTFDPRVASRWPPPEVGDILIIAYAVRYVEIPAGKPRPIFSDDSPVVSTHRLEWPCH